MPSAKQARIIGNGSYVPAKILSNRDLEQLVETSDEWILTRTGIKERRIAGPEETPSFMGAEAAKIAIANALIKPIEIDLILVATMTPDYPCPSTAALIQEKIGASRAGAVDLQAACTGFIYGLSMAKAYIESGMYRHILLVATEKMSSVTDYTDRNTCVLFGDGAAAAIISNQGEGLKIEATHLGANGSLANLLIVPAGGTQLPASHGTIDQRQHYFRMEGKEVFKHAVRLMTQAGRNCLDLTEVTQEDLTWIVPHQANERIIDAIARAFDVPLHKVFKTVHKYGNTSASSIPMALYDLQKEHSLNSGNHLLLLGFGAGATYGAALLTKI